MSDIELDELGGKIDVDVLIEEEREGGREKEDERKEGSERKGKREKKKKEKREGKERERECIDKDTGTNEIYTLALHDALPSCQQNANEFLLRAMGEYTLQAERNWLFGLGLRRGDALILYGGIQLPGIRLGLSYDSTISGLKAVSRGNGAFEFSAILYLKRRKKDLPKAKVVLADRDGSSNSERCAGLQQSAPRNPHCFPPD